MIDNKKDDSKEIKNKKNNFPEMIKYIYILLFIDLNLSYLLVILFFASCSETPFTSVVLP